MKIENIHNRVDGIPHMTKGQAQTITNFIMENQFQNILELGFRHGVSSCYMAGALDELGTGTITTVDLVSAQNANPNIETLLNELGLQDFVTVYFEQTSYTWRLMKMIEEDSSPRFDFCYLDGAHSWFVDGFTFFLIERLLLPGGWIIFDDLDWTYGSSPSLKNTARVKAMPRDEIDTAQVRKVYELLVKTHPSFHNFLEKGQWGFAQKVVS